MRRGDPAGPGGASADRGIRAPGADRPTRLGRDQGRPELHRQGGARSRSDRRPGRWERDRGERGHGGRRQVPRVEPTNGDGQGDRRPDRGRHRRLAVGRVPRRAPYPWRMAQQPAAFRDRIGVLKPLRVRDFRLMWTGLAVSMIGDGIYIIALALLVLNDLGRSNSTLALVQAAVLLPQVTFVLGAGVLADRLDRRRLMITADAIRFVAIAAIGT